ncbi:MAG: hypothetical protein FWF60_00085 [Oscillospiraceae bacterium]|nr:hypothetical protein [Oscillospiraceae bacterium]
MSEHVHPYRKLGGFLLFLVIMTFISAFFNTIKLLFSQDGFMQSMQSYTGGELWLQLLVALCLAYTITLQVMYCVMILRRDPRFARTWQLIYIGTLVSALATLAVHRMYGYPQAVSAYNASPAFAMGYDLVNFLRIPVGLPLVTLYFLKSVRVRTYMASGKYLKLAFFTRKAAGPEPSIPDPVMPDEEG